MPNLKDALRRNELTIGSWITLGHRGIAEIMASAGFDWLAIDLEHSVIDLSETLELIAAIEAVGVTPLVRLTSQNPDLAKRVLDAGARGIIVPMVMNAGQAQAAVDSARYPPQGRRSVGLSRAQGYGAKFEHYISTIEPEIVVVAQIEHVEAIDALEGILRVPGIDATIIGPYDLSASIGKPGVFSNPALKSLLDRYERDSHAASKTMGYHVVQPDAALIAEKYARGYRFIGFSADFLFLAAACGSGLRELRESIRAAVRTKE